MPDTPEGDGQQRWDIQGFHTGDAGQAMWSTGVTGNDDVIAYLTHALDESDAAVFLIRRGPQVELYDEPEVHPYRLVAADARDRIARHLWAAEGNSVEAWQDDVRYLAQADAILAAINPDEC